MTPSREQAMASADRMELELQFEGRPVRAFSEGPAEGSERRPTVLFLHPYPLQADAWSGLATACAREGYRAVAFDLPGFGRSAAWGSPLAVESLAHLAAAVLDRVGAARAALVGCSLGGYVSLAFGRLYPERLWGLALMNTKAGADSDAQREGREAGARLALSEGAAAAVAGLLPKLLAPGLPERDPGLWAGVLELSRGASAQGVADALRGMALRPDATSWLPLCPVRALVVTGELDQLTPRADMELLARGLPGARWEILPGAGHYSFLEAPGAVEQALLSYLAEQRR